MEITGSQHVKNARISKALDAAVRSHPWKSHTLILVRLANRFWLALYSNIPIFACFELRTYHKVAASFQRINRRTPAPIYIPLVDTPGTPWYVSNQFRK